MLPLPLVPGQNCLCTFSRNLRFPPGQVTRYASSQLQLLLHISTYLLSHLCIRSSVPLTIISLYITFFSIHPSPLLWLTHACYHRFSFIFHIHHFLKSFCPAFSVAFCVNIVALYSCSSLILLFYPISHFYSFPVQLLTFTCISCNFLLNSSASPLYFLQSLVSSFF